MAANAFDEFGDSGTAATTATANPFDEFDAPPDLTQDPLPPITNEPQPDAAAPQIATSSDGDTAAPPWYQRLLQKDPELEKLPWYQRIGAGAEQAAEAIDPSGALRARLSAPTDFPAPNPEFLRPNPDDNAVVASGKAVASLPGHIWDFLSSPGGAAIAASGAVIPPALLAAGFTAQQGAQALTTPNLSTQERVELGLGALLGAKGAHEAVKAGDSIAPTQSTDNLEPISTPEQELAQQLREQGAAERGDPVVASELPAAQPPAEQAASVPETPQVAQADATAPASDEQAAATGPVPVDEGFVSRIANRFTQEESGQGRLGEVAPGPSEAPETVLQRGLRMSPEEVATHISDIVQGKGGNELAQGAAVRAEAARLSDRSTQLSKIADADPTNSAKRQAADQAFQYLTDFHNGPVAKIKTRFHQTGMTLQGEIPADLSTYNGIREDWLNANGKAPPEAMEPIMRKAASRVADSIQSERASGDRLGEAIDNASRGRDIPEAEMVRNNLMERMKDVPCRV